MIRSSSIAALLITVAVPVLASPNEEFPTKPIESVSIPATSIAWKEAPAPRRPAVLPALYGTFAALQVIDVGTTRSAIANGAHEANPVLGPGSSARIWAIKAATTASTIYFVERLWKRNRMAAVLVMTGINGGYAAVAAHNARQAR